MKKNVGLFLAITLTLLMLSIVSITGWVKAQPNFQETRASVLYVTISGSGTCTSWADACGLQTALAGAIAGDEIWVETGTYLPTNTTDTNNILRTEEWRRHLRRFYWNRDHS